MKGKVASPRGALTEEGAIKQASRTPLPGVRRDSRLVLAWARFER
jgi:hypothetical protein